MMISQGKIVEYMQSAWFWHLQGKSHGFSHFLQLIDKLKLLYFVFLHSKNNEKSQKDIQQWSDFPPRLSKQPGKNSHSLRSRIRMDPNFELQICIRY